jgi:glycosyltransferase involved in cell wall biosynthesis
MSTREDLRAQADVEGLLELEVRLWRDLRAATRRSTLLRQQLRTLRARPRPLDEVDRGIDEVLDRYDARRGPVPQDVVTFPRRMVAFANGCLSLGPKLAADAYLSHDNLPLLAATMLRRAHGGQIVYDAIEMPDLKSRSIRHFDPEVRPIEAFLRLFNETVLPQVDTAMTVSPSICAHIQDSGLPCVTVENFRYYEELERDLAMREDCGVAEDEILALQLNNLYPTFGFETILEFWAKLAPTFKLATLGRIYPEDYKRRLQGTVTELGIKDRVRFLDPVPYDRVASYASGADFMLMKRTREIPNNDWSLPNRVFDSLAARLPLCSSELTDIQNFIREHEMGATFDPESYESFEVSVTDIAANLETYRENTARAAQECDWRSHDRRIETAVGPGSSVVILGIRDVCNNMRCRRIAETLLRIGRKVTIVGSEEPVNPHPDITYHVVDIEVQAPKVEGVRTSG